MTGVDPSSPPAGGPLKPPELPRRFYEAVAVADRDGLSVVTLDGRVAKTPGRSNLGTASQTITTAMAAEWDAQTETINPALMPLTRIVNSAIDGVADKMTETRADIVSYAGNDLLCYRAESPESLAARQAEHWDPVLDWLATTFSARLTVTSGIIPVDQPTKSLEGFAASLDRFDPLSLSALHITTTLTGSAVLAIAVAEGHLTPEEAWERAHIDEDWQAAQWGTDVEASKRREARWRDMAAAALILNEA